MKIQAPKRILTDDFDDDDKSIAGKIGGLINTFNEELYSMSSSNITIADNLDQVIKIMKFEVDSTGKPATDISFQNTLKGKIQGCQVIRAIGNSYPTNQPFISYVESGGVVTINHVSGLPADTEFQLVVLLIGQ